MENIHPSFYWKQPYEEETIYIDWANRIASGDSLTATFSLKIYDKDAVDKSTTMLGTPARTGNKIYVTVKAGTAGQTYLIVNQVTTTLGDKKEVDLPVLIKEL